MYQLHIIEQYNNTDVCWLNQQSVRLIIGRSWVQSLAASYQKTLKGGSCCYPVWRSTFERDRATSIWRCSVAAGPTINWAKRFSISDNKIIYCFFILFIIIVMGLTMNLFLWQQQVFKTGRNDRLVKFCLTSLRCNSIEVKNQDQSCYVVFNKHDSRDYLHVHVCILY